MALSNQLISQFVKATNDNKKAPTETTVHGTTVSYNGRTYVKLDGSELLTPVKSTVSVNEGDKVTVVINNHTATVTGNISDPSASSKTVEKQGSKINEFDIVMAYKINTDDFEAVNAFIENLKTRTAHIENADIINADIEKLYTIFANIEYLSANDIKAITATIETIHAKIGDFENISTEDLEAINAEIDNLKAYTANFTYVSAEVLEAMKANITMIEAEKLSVKDADLKYANIDFSNIDFSNIGHAVMEDFYSNSGLIRDVVIDNGTITGELVGVTIKGDLLEGNTVVADKLVIKGDDGLYYKLNMSVYDSVYYEVEYNSETGEYVSTDSVINYDVENSTILADAYTTDGDNVYLHTTEDGDDIYFIKTLVYKDERVNVNEIPRETLNGTVITAKTVTAEKVSVSDLVAFDATIGGFKITDRALYSGVKTSVDNATQGTYLDSEGQLNVGDATNFIRYYKDVDGSYRLVISADSIMFGTNDNLAKILEYIRIDVETGSMTFGAGANAMSLTLDNDMISFSKNGEPFGWWDGDNFHSGNIMINVTERAQFGNYAFIPRTDGSLSFLKVSNNSGFYGVVSGKTLFIYGSYPTLSETTMEITDISARLEETTLILGGE